MKAADRKIIEQFVNSEEAVRLVEEHWDWDGLHRLLSNKLVGSLTDDEWGRLEADLRNWWEFGNFRVWEKGEVDDIGLTAWEWGDLDFWD